MDAADHCVYDGRAFMCFHCGGTFDPFQPEPYSPRLAAIPPWMFQAAVEHFAEEHEECDPAGRVAVEAALESKRRQAATSWVTWIHGPDTGISSATIWSVMTGGRPERYSGQLGEPPHDPSDFGRCHRLLLAFPEWRERLDAVAERYPAWAPLVSAWDELTALYEQESLSGSAPQLYARMQQCLNEGGAFGPSAP